MPRCSVAFIDRSKEYRSTAGYGSFHTHFGVWVMLIVEYPIVTVICRTAIQVLLLYFNRCLIVMLDSLWCPFTSISCLITCNWLSFMQSLIGKTFPVIKVYSCECIMREWLIVEDETFNFQLFFKICIQSIK